MSSPVVSVVVPVGSVDDELAAALGALAAQDLDEPWELVISLNTPLVEARDRLDKMLTEIDLDVRLVDSSDRRDAAHARNVGAAAARGDLIAFCDGDDQAEPSWLAAIVTALATSPAVGGHLEESSLVDPAQRDWRPPATPGALPTFLGGAYPVSANMGIRSALFEQIGGFREDLTRCEDIAFGWSLIEHGQPAVYCPEAVVQYRHRRGYRALVRQHVLYGRGMSEVIVRCGVPGSEPGARQLLRPNSQPVDHRGIPYVVRRASLAIGRVIGIITEWVRRRRPSEGDRDSPS